MRAEERHELRENDLANWLHYGMLGWLRQNGSYLLLIAALAFLGYTLWNRHQENLLIEKNNATYGLNNALGLAFSPQIQQNAHVGDAVLHVNETYQEAPATMSADPKQKVESFTALDQLASVVAGDSDKFLRARAALELGKLYDQAVAGSIDLLKQRGLTREAALSKAYDNYNKVLELVGDDPLMSAQAHLGMAAVYEDRGDQWDKAKAEYEAMISNKMYEGPLASAAKARLDALNDRRNAPRLSAWTPPAVVAPTPAPSSPFSLPSPGSIMSPSTGGGFNFPGGLNLGTPPATPSTSSSTTPPASRPFNLNLSPIGPSLSPSTSQPFLPEPSTQPK